MRWQIRHSTTQPQPEATVAELPSGTGPEAESAVTFPEPLTYDAPTLRSEPVGIPTVSVAVPDTVVDGAAWAGLTIRAASLRGDDHRYYAQPRQDSMAVWALDSGDSAKPGALLVCVADGVGSEPNSQHGSEAACRILRDLLQAEHTSVLNADTDQLQSYAPSLIGRLSERLIRTAQEFGCEPRSISTTLVAALIEAEPVDPARRRCLLFKVGDSPALLLRDGRFSSCFDQPADGLISSTATDALPAEFPRVGFREVGLLPDDVLVLCSDGLSGPMHNEAVTAQLAEFWSRGPIPGLPEFSWQLAFRVKSYGDDRTAVCVWGR